MTADEIRDLPIVGEHTPFYQAIPQAGIDDCAKFLREIAAQLAELNARLAKHPTPLEYEMANPQ